MGWSIHTIRKNTESLVINRLETGIETNSEKSKYMIMSQDQKEGQNGNTQIGNKLFQTLEQFKFLEKTLKGSEFQYGEIKSRLKSGNACYHFVQSLLFSSLLSKCVKIIYRNIILPVVLYCCENWSVTLKEECRLKVFENRVLRRIFGSKWDEVRGEWRRLDNKELYTPYIPPNMGDQVKKTKMGRTCSTFGGVERCIQGFIGKT